jgi:hypothetical protein|nr:MAG TPA: type I restriction enzyme [Caudoviricetes sp.]
MIKTEKRKIETLFDISRNPRINLVDMLPGEIPLVTNSKTIPAYTVGNDVPTTPRGTITVSKFGHTNYIDEPFIASDIMTLQPLDEESKAPEFGLYVSTQLNVAFEYANYNDLITLQILKETEIEVPVTEAGDIDYDAVRDKMTPIMEKAQKHVDQLVTQYQRYKEKKNGKL